MYDMIIRSACGVHAAQVIIIIIIILFYFSKCSLKPRHYRQEHCCCCCFPYTGQFGKINGKKTLKNTLLLVYFIALYPLLLLLLRLYFQTFQNYKKKSKIPSVRIFEFVNKMKQEFRTWLYSMFKFLIWKLLYN